jgi:hypothetical protein
MGIVGTMASTASAWFVALGLAFAGLGVLAHVVQERRRNAVIWGMSRVFDLTPMLRRARYLSKFGFLSGEGCRIATFYYEGKTIEVKGPTGWEYVKTGWRGGDPEYWVNVYEGPYDSPIRRQYFLRGSYCLAPSDLNVFHHISVLYCLPDGRLDADFYEGVSPARLREEVDMERQFGLGYATPEQVNMLQRLLYALGPKHQVRPMILWEAPYPS